MKNIDEIIIRKIKEEEIMLLEDRLYDSIFQADERNSIPRDVIYAPRVHVYIENFGSEFVVFDVPEVMLIPTVPGEVNRELMTAEVMDPEGLFDIDSVYFFSLKPDSTLANGGQPFILVDNGLPFNPDGNLFIETGDENADDGIEFFGGTVNAKYVVLTANKDDSVDWDNGYRGNLQYVLVKHAIGPYPGFLMGWTDWLSFGATLALKVTVLVEYVALLAPVIDGWQTSIAFMIDLADQINIPLFHM